jgi:O-acetyl-ADP-ribose deacetylase (regulator of RNase III)
LKIATERKYSSIAFPIIGSGTGGFAKEMALEIMRDEIEKNSYAGEIRVVRYSQEQTKVAPFRGKR